MGRDLAGLSNDEMHKIRGNDIAMVFQDPMTSLNPTKTIGDQVAEPVRIHRGGRKKRRSIAPSKCSVWWAFPRPKERLSDFPHQLSGGMRQRVMIAMALACDPKLLIADEPTTALDVTIQAQILELLSDLKQKLGMSVILITHDMGVIAGRTDRVMVMYAGKVVEATSTKLLFDEMRHPYSQALLASIPRLEQDNRQRLYSIPGLPPDLTNPPVGCRFAPRCRARPTMPTSRSRRSTVSPSEHVFACWHPIDGPLDLSASRRTRRDAEADQESPVLLNVETSSRSFPSAGVSSLASKVQRCTRCQTSPSACEGARRLAWSASRAAARRRSGA